MSEENIEIDLRTIIDQILSNLISIFAIISSFLIFGYFLFQNIEDKWNGQIEVSFISSQEKSLYTEFVIALDDIKLNSDSLGISTSHLMLNSELLDTYLLNLFYEQLIDRNEIVDYLMLNNIVAKNSLDDEDYKILLREISQNVFVKKNIDKNGLIESLSINYNSSSKKNIRDLFNYTIRQVNGNVSSYMISEIQNQKNITSNLITQKVNQIKDEVILHSSSYEDLMEQRLLFLTEQSQIARSLNLQTNELTQSIILDEFKTDENDFTPPYYLRGYVAIEKEIDLIKNRPIGQILTDEMLEFNSDLRKYEKFRNDLSSFDKYNLTPLGTSSFTSITFDIDSIKYSNTKITLIQTLVASLALSLIIVFLYLTYRWLYRAD
jgi:LPS O-antigen subunit length determinant protein (WzzB/FepE family)